MPFGSSSPSLASPKRRGDEDLQEVMEAVDVGSKVGCKYGAVMDCIPLQELLPEPAGEMQRMLSAMGTEQAAEHCSHCVRGMSEDTGCWPNLSAYMDFFFLFFFQLS